MFWFQFQKPIFDLSEPLGAFVAGTGAHCHHCSAFPVVTFLPWNTSGYDIDLLPSIERLIFLFAGLPVNHVTICLNYYTDY